MLLPTIAAISLTTPIAFQSKITQANNCNNSNNICQTTLLRITPSL